MLAQCCFMAKPAKSSAVVSAIWYERAKASFRSPITHTYIYIYISLSTYIYIYLTYVDKSTPILRANYELISMILYYSSQCIVLQSLQKLFQFAFQMVCLRLGKKEPARNQKLPEPLQNILEHEENLSGLPYHPIHCTLRAWSGMIFLRWGYCPFGGMNLVGHSHKALISYSWQRSLDYSKVTASAPGMAGVRTPDTLRSMPLTYL